MKIGIASLTASAGSSFMIQTRWKIVAPHQSDCLSALIFLKDVSSNLKIFMFASGSVEVPATVATYHASIAAMTPLLSGFFIGVSAFPVMRSDQTIGIFGNASVLRY